MRARRLPPLQELPNAQRAYLEKGEWCDGGGFPFFGFVYMGGAQRTWRALGDALLTAWIAEHPGTRPFLWWLVDAPAEPVFCHNTRIEHLAHRRRLGGVGTPCHEVLNYAPAFRFGLPEYWVSAFDEAYYNGRANDVHGNLIETKYREGHFKGRAINLFDPPIFESQAAFLRRHHLLTPDEQGRLRDQDFEPEALQVETTP